MNGPNISEPIEPAGFFDGLRPRAILVGVLVDNVATFFSGVLLMLSFSGGEITGAGKEIPEQVFETIASTPEFLLASLVTGLLCTVFGGYVAAKRAHLYPVRHGAWVGMAAALMGLLFYASPEQMRSPYWFELSGFLFVIPAGATGGLIARLIAERSMD